LNASLMIENILMVTIVSASGSSMQTSTTKIRERIAQVRGWAQFVLSVQSDSHRLDPDHIPRAEAFVLVCRPDCEVPHVDFRRTPTHHKGARQVRKV